jgi:hypothetical protein
MRIALAVSALLALGAGGCISADSAYRGVYHGLQVREEIVDPTPSQGGPQRRIGYDEYQAERQRRPRAD